MLRDEIRRVETFQEIDADLKTIFSCFNLTKGKESVAKVHQNQHKTLHIFWLMIIRREFETLFKLV